MKQEEVKVGLYVTQDGRTHCKVSRVDGNEWTAWLPPGGLSISSNDAWRPSLPAELSAAGIADADRLCEQQSWREGVRLWDTPNSYTDKHCWVSIDSDVTVATVSRSAIVDDKPIAKAPGIDVPEIEVTNRDNYSWAWQAPHLRDFVLNFRSARAAEGKKRLACGHVLKAGDVTTALGTFRFWQVEPKERIARWIWEKEQERFGRACVQDADPSERLIIPADAPELLKQNFPTDKLPADVRQAVEALRRPTLPDGSRIEVGEMYVSNRGWLQLILSPNVPSGTFLRQYFDPNCRRLLMGLPVDYRGACSSVANNLVRLAQPADIANEIDINIVPERIRDEVIKRRSCKVEFPFGTLDCIHESDVPKSSQQRGAGALKWNGWYIFRQLGNEQQRWEFGQWVPVPDPHKTIDEMATASPSQIIAANVPEQDIPACQIEGVREERRKASELSGDELIEIGKRACKRMSDLRDEVVAAEKSASPSSPAPESGSCQCEAANTLRNLIEVYDRFISAKTVSDWVDETKNLGREFELARESLGEASNTEAA